VVAPLLPLVPEVVTLTVVPVPDPLLAPALAPPIVLPLAPPPVGPADPVDPLEPEEPVPVTAEVLVGSGVKPPSASKPQ
jgi:hypothetical protein